MKVLYTLVTLTLLLSSFRPSLDSTNAIIKSIETTSYQAKSEKKKGSINRTIKEEYNEKGQIVRSQIFKEGKYAWNITEYTYDENGRNTVTKILKSDGSLITELKYEFNEQGQKISEKQFDEGIEKKRIDFIWENGVIVKEKKFSTYGFEKLLSYKTFKYDEHGNVIENAGFGKTGSKRSVKTYAYPELDENGNWLTKKYWKDGEIRMIIERVITYQ